MTSIKNCLSDGSPLAYFIYDYDAASRITSIQRENGDIIYYGYDHPNRLTSENWKDSVGSSIYAFSWDYDAVGNRTYQKRDGSEAYYDYNAGNEVVHSVTDGQHSYYSYDSRGNCTHIESPAGTQYFAYDHRDLVTGIRYRDGSTQYFHHDGTMRMYAMDDSGVVTYFTWDKSGLNVLSERDASGNVIAEYTHGDVPVAGSGSMVAAKKVESGTTYYQYPAYNHHGDVIKIVDENGAAADSYEYNAWGVPLCATESGASNRFGWQSNWLTLKEGIYKSPGRLYLDDVGRFLQRDDLSRGGSYDYGFNNPSVFVDPDGLAAASAVPDWITPYWREKWENMSAKQRKELGPLAADLTKSVIYWRISANLQKCKDVRVVSVARLSDVRSWLAKATIKPRDWTGTPNAETRGTTIYIDFSDMPTWVTFLHELRHLALNTWTGLDEVSYTRWAGLSYYMDAVGCPARIPKIQRRLAKADCDPAWVKEEWGIFMEQMRQKARQDDFDVPRKDGRRRKPAKWTVRPADLELLKKVVNFDVDPRKIWEFFKDKCCGKGESSRKFSSIVSKPKLRGRGGFIP